MVGLGWGWGWGWGMGVGWVGGWVGGHWTLLYKSVPNAMPGLLVFHVHHTFCNFHSDWVLQDLPIFTFQPGVDSWFTVRQFCIKCHASATCCPCPPYICNIQVEWLDSAGFANFLFLTSQSAVSLANQSTPSQPKLLPQFVYGISPQNPPHPP